ncbi:hypothetical protein [Shewanella sp.]|uniref:hypothetical protein n=1 Tax=Shewanella sp. TaxID=50422 RepID=UPI0040548BF4
MFDPECLICCLEGGSACSVHGQVAASNERIAPSNERPEAVFVAKQDREAESQVAVLVAKANILMHKAAALSANASPLCEVQFKRDLACFYGFTALDNFSRSQVGRIIEVLQAEPELLEVKADRLEALAAKVVSKALLGDANKLPLPKVSVDWFLGYLQMQEKRAERSIEMMSADPVNQAKHIKRRDIYCQLRTNLARDIYARNN